MDKVKSWERFKEESYFNRELGISLDFSGAGLPADFFVSQSSFADIHKSMIELEAGSIANPDEKRMVGHYWLRAPGLAPDMSFADDINATVSAVKDFANSVLDGSISNPAGKAFSNILLIGIGGSALGPQLAARALADSPKLKLHFLDNTDPDGMDLVLSSISDLSETLCIVISKSGGTVETRNAMKVAQLYFKEAKLDFSKHAVAITGKDSKLDKEASNWLTRFYMWDWVGGRTSQTSAVGLLPMALQGLNIDEMLRGAKEMDELTRSPELKSNPAAMLAYSWHFLGEGHGNRNMVVLPYRDRLDMMARYLQQLVMESIGKERDLSGEVVEQGISVFGNKGSTDQHAFVQQLRDGRNDFFVTFIEVLKDFSASSPTKASTYKVEDDRFVGDYLFGFFRGTRNALLEKERPSITISIESLSEYSFGQLLALFERTVGYYASLVNINAYNQPGVEAGKKAAKGVLELQSQVLSVLSEANEPIGIESLTEKLSSDTDCEDVFALLRRLAANSRVKVVQGESVLDDKYEL